MVKLSLYNNYKLLLDTSNPSLQSFHLSIQSLFKVTKLWHSEKINLWAIEFNMSHDATTNAIECVWRILLSIFPSYLQYEFA